MRPGIPPLAGHVIAVTADRRAEEQVTLLERRGAEVLVAPTVRTVPLVDDERLSAAIDEVIARPPDVVVLLTGIGARALFAAAESRGRDEELADALSSSLVVARGPKAVGAATTIGLDVAWHARSERAREILERLTPNAAAGARIAVQRDGQQHAELADALAELGADAVDIPVYRWELPEDTRPASRLVDAIVAGDVDAVTFTSSPAVRHLLAVADDGRRDALVEALQRRVAAVCVGPVCAETAEGLSIPAAVVPRRSRMGAMVQALTLQCAGRGLVVVTRTGDVTIQGRAVFVDGHPVAVPARERAVLEVLAGANGAVVAKPRLLRDVWGPEFSDEHAVEVTIARLRRALGPAGDAVETVPRRGYRLAA